MHQIGDEKIVGKKIYVYVGDGQWKEKPSATSTEEKQNTIISELGDKTEEATQALILISQETLNRLVETLNETNSRLMVLASMANSGAPALRVAPISSVSTTVTGNITTVSNLTNFGTGIPASEMAHDMNNLVAIFANINNVVITP